MGKLENKAAIITGAASGIGRATALKFAREGARVVVADLNGVGGEEVVKEIQQQGGRAVFQKTNVASETEVRDLVARAVSEFGYLDIIYNNAGIAGANGPIETIGADDWDRTMAVVLKSVFLGMKYAVPEMRKRGGGSIISTSSGAATRGIAGVHAYSAAKAGIIALTQSAAVELGKDWIRVNCILPGTTNTPILHRNAPGGAEAIEKMMQNSQPLRRVGRPDDIANMALFLASDDSSWITGQSYSVDGGGLIACPITGGGDIVPPGFHGPSFQN